MILNIKRENMNLRPYKKEDAVKILSWIKNEREFRLWSADRYKNYPCQPSDINDNYLNCMKTLEQKKSI